ncbi:MAG: ABC transporter ATP-binding protein [Verrucomicrobiaceae bacterium]|nr:ABC transporter ATP-binding protein [Verrucomicrobiaceae bacterium]
MIRCKKIDFRYPGESFQLSIDDFFVGKGETVALIGPSGCGKTTLMNLISGILTPAEGSVTVNGVLVNELAVAARQRFRLAKIGLVPQNFELLDYLTIRENILVPFHIGAELRFSEEMGERCEDLAERAGIAAQLDKFPRQLSQGERQRAALCRGLVTSPPLLLADEPTGNLDPDNQDKIVSLLLGEAARIGASVLMITHDPLLLPRFGRVVEVGKLRRRGGGA